jgi:hypothetical protein
MSIDERLRKASREAYWAFSEAVSREAYWAFSEAVSWTTSWQAYQAAFWSASRETSWAASRVAYGASRCEVCSYEIQVDILKGLLNEHR